MSGSVALFATGEHEFNLDAAAEWAEQVRGEGRWRSAGTIDEVDPEDEPLDDDLDADDLDEDDEFDDPEDADDEDLDEDALEDDDELGDLDDDLIDLDDEYDTGDDEDRGLGGHRYDD